MEERHKKIRFNGYEYWLHNDLISPLDHFDEEGKLLANPVVDISFAVIEGSDILRYGGIIGTMEEVEYI